MDIFICLIDLICLLATAWVASIFHEREDAAKEKRRALMTPEERALDEEYDRIPGGLVK